MSRLLVFLLELYKRRISPLLPAACRFSPTCSQYGQDAIRLHGALRGSALAVWRIARCNPYGRGGFDPVPPARRLHGHQYDNIAHVNEEASA